MTFDEMLRYLALGLVASVASGIVVVMHDHFGADVTRLAVFVWAMLTALVLVDPEVRWT